MQQTPQKDYYEILQVPKGASAKEIAEAYHYMKNTYRKSNQALYSLMSEQDLQGALNAIEEAYIILSHPQEKYRYDQQYTSRAGASSSSTQESYVHHDSSKKELDNPSHYGFSLKPRQRTLSSMTPKEEQAFVALSEDFDQADGQLLKNLRQMRSATIEDLCNYTKISLSCLENIEANRYESLPQPIYVKGYLKIYLQFLSLPNSEKILEGYMKRFQSWLLHKK